MVADTLKLYMYMKVIQLWIQQFKIYTYLIIAFYIMSTVQTIISLRTPTFQFPEMVRNQMNKCILTGAFAFVIRIRMFTGDTSIDIHSPVMWFGVGFFMYAKLKKAPTLNKTPVFS